LKNKDDYKVDLLLSNGQIKDHQQLVTNENSQLEQLHHQLDAHNMILGKL
jgi:hypothetical protein